MTQLPILKELKSVFGNLSYFNDNRKTFKRIKIYNVHPVCDYCGTPKQGNKANELNKIFKYLKHKYPKLEVYYNRPLMEPCDWMDHYNGLCIKMKR